MSIRRMSFKETQSNISTQEYLNDIGFQNRLSFGLKNNTTENYLIINKGSLLYGFKNRNSDTYGFIYDTDIKLFIPNNRGVYYLTCEKENGLFNPISLGDFNYVSGLGANFSGIPWYTYNGHALLGKIFQPLGFISDLIVCDDAYWCEYER